MSTVNACHNSKLLNYHLSLYFYDKIDAHSFIVWGENRRDTTVDLCTVTQVMTTICHDKTLQYAPTSSHAQQVQLHENILIIYYLTESVTTRALHS